jgi:2-methylisocitrate lyase-like PEP mutase family enzyme
VSWEHHLQKLRELVQGKELVVAPMVFDPITDRLAATSGTAFAAIDFTAMYKAVPQS